MIATSEAPAAAVDTGFTPAQRMHLELNGYVVVEGFVPRGECAELRELLFEIEARFRADGAFPSGIKSLFCSDRFGFRIDNLPHVAPCFLRYLADPRIVARAEEMVGGEVRLEQSDAHIRRPNPQAPDTYGFHRGGRWNFGACENGLFHYPFIKALTNLDDLGPDDGGTAVIAGSHKVPPLAEEAAKAAALSDPSLIRTVVAPAGSTLFFFEALLHASGINRSGKPRPLVLGGYTPSLFQPQSGYEPEPGFLETLGERERELLSGSRGWGGREFYRRLD
jgi:hypothetical protein